MKGPAKLARYTGSGALTVTSTERGDRVLTGLWQPDEPEQAYHELHRFYMARERIPYRGPVEESDDEPGPPLERTVDVIILEWSNEDHPSALKLQAAEGGTA